MDKVSARQSKVKRLNDNIKPKNVAPRSPSNMSETALKRWCEARDTYLDDRYAHVSTPRRSQQKPKVKSVISHRYTRPSKIEFQPPPPPPPVEQPLTVVLEIVDDPIDTKCVGTETEDSAIFCTEIEHIDEAIQADLPSPQIESPPDDHRTTIETEQEKNEELIINEKPVEYDDKATETDVIIDTKKEEEIELDYPISNEVTVEPIPTEKIPVEPIQNEENPVEPILDEINSIESIPNEENPIEPILNEENPIEPINDDDTKSMLSSHKSERSLQQQLRRLRHRFKRVSKERRLLICLLMIYLIIMFGLLIVIFILIWAFQQRSLIVNQEVTIISTEVVNGVARYGELCRSDNDCKRPFTCYKAKSSSSGACRCPLRYDFDNGQCVGDLNALCTKDTNCQRYMLCSGMHDGTRRCQCQTLYIYDSDRRQCRGDYEAPCRRDTDCRANLICNTTIHPSLCSCPINYRYYPLVQKCRGDPGALCEQATAECVDNAECRDGACECAFQFIPNEKKICIDPCPKPALNRVKIRYPGHCRRFIDCKKRTKNECPEMTIFNFRTQLCDYRKNVLDC